MEQIIIIAPPEIDVSEAVKILKLDGVEVSVVAPSPANFLHFALGMIPDHPNDGVVDTENDDTADEDVPGDIEKPPEKSTEEEKEEPADKKNSEKPNGVDKESEETKEIGECLVNGERIKVYLTNKPSYIEVTNLSIGLKNNFNINESSFSFWNTTNENHLHHNFYVAFGDKMSSLLLEVKNSTSNESRLFLSTEQVTKLK